MHANEYERRLFTGKAYYVIAGVVGTTTDDLVT
jgi:hypothetical protein